MEPEAYIVEEESEKTTGIGKTLSFAALTLAASTFKSLRFKLGGLLLHPADIFLMIPFTAAAPNRLRLLPLPILLALLSFTAVFVTSTMGAPKGLPYAAKVIASLVTVIAGAVAVQNDKDVRSVSFSMLIAACVIGLRGFVEPVGSGLAGLNPMEGVANKNAFSLYALPGLLLATHFVLDPTTPRKTRLFLIGPIVLVIVSVFATANRSGWLGVLLVFLFFAYRVIRSFRKFLLLAMLVSGAYVAVSLSNREMIEYKIQQTQEGYSSDHLRLELFVAAVKIGLEHPLIGVSPQRVPYEIARHSPVSQELFDTHNVFGLLAGGGGSLQILTLLFLAFALWKRPVGWGRGLSRTPAGDAHFLLRAMVALWAVRGFFTAEILYSPSFSLGVGVCIGFCILREVWGSAEVAEGEEEAEPIEDGSAVTEVGA
jgi:O-antigen ligase